MIEAVDTRARGLRSRRDEKVEVASIVRRLDWILLASVGAIVGYGLWAIAGITRHDVPGDANYYVTRQSVYAVFGRGTGGDPRLDVEFARDAQGYILLQVRPALFLVTLLLVLGGWAVRSVVRGRRATRRYAEALGYNSSSNPS